MELVPLGSEGTCRLHVMRAPQNIAVVVDLYGILAEKMRRRNLMYLSLPTVLTVIGKHPLYEQAPCWGRGFYYEGRHERDEATDTLVSVPPDWSRSDIPDVLKGFLSAEDMRLPAPVLLTWCGGECWLALGLDGFSTG